MPIIIFNRPFVDHRRVENFLVFRNSRRRRREELIQKKDGRNSVNETSVQESPDEMSADNDF